MVEGHWIWWVGPVRTNSQVSNTPSPLHAAVDFIKVADNRTGHCWNDHRACIRLCSSIPRREGREASAGKPGKGRGVCLEAKTMDNGSTRFLGKWMAFRGLGPADKID